MVRFVVDDGDVEGVEEVGELGVVVAGECRAQVGDRRQQRFDFMLLRRVVAAGLEAAQLVVECGSLACELFDAFLRCSDDGVGGVVVFFEAEALPSHRLVELGELMLSPGELDRVVVVDGFERLGQLVVEESEPVGTEEAAAEEVEQRVEDQLFADAEDARVSGGVGCGDAAPVDELTAVPVGALLEATFHPPAADPAMDAAAERVEAPGAAAGSLHVVLRRGER